MAVLPMGSRGSGRVYLTMAVPSFRAPLLADARALLVAAIAGFLCGGAVAASLWPDAGAGGVAPTMTSSGKSTAGGATPAAFRGDIITGACAHGCTAVYRPAASSRARPQTAIVASLSRGVASDPSPAATKPALSSLIAQRIGPREYLFITGMSIYRWSQPRQPKSDAKARGQDAGGPQIPSALP
jgi:hypothetical protein